MMGHVQALNSVTLASLDLTNIFFVDVARALAPGDIAGVNRNAAASYFMRLRRLIAMHRPVIVCLGKLWLMKATLAECEKASVLAELPGK